MRCVALGCGFVEQGGVGGPQLTGPIRRWAPVGDKTRGTSVMCAQRERRVAIYAVLRCSLGIQLDRSGTEVEVYVLLAKLNGVQWRRR